VFSGPIRGTRGFRGAALHERKHAGDRPAPGEVVHFQRVPGSANPLPYWSFCTRLMAPMRPLSSRRMLAARTVLRPVDEDCGVPS